MKPADLTTTGENQFYPTPPRVAEKMLAGIDFNFIGSVLEPSAGKGDLIDPLIHGFYSYRGYSGRELDVDACEIDPYLRSIIKYRFSEEARCEIASRWRALDNLPRASLTEEQKDECRFLRREMDALSSGAVHVVHDDFLSYWTYKHYDLILMNPPFANGDLHLLKAIDMQRRGGKIICLLNAETLRNPYTATRQQLQRELQRLDAKIEYLENAFADAERQASVDVAIVRIDIEAQREESDIWERMKKAVVEEDVPDPELHELVPADYIEAAIQHYKAEVAATMELVRQYRALAPYMSRSLKGDHSLDKSPILTLTVTDDNYLRGFDMQKYMRLVRLKYWEALFTNPQFTGKLTSDLQKTYRENVSRMANYEFSAFNIKQILLEMNAAISQGVEDAIIKLFDTLTVEHSWYPECANNRHYFNGWATNKAHKIGKKCIIPTHGMFSSYSWSRDAFDVNNAYTVISDLEKAFDYLDGGETSEINLRARLQVACNAGQTRNIECKYFKIDLFKKGTTHIKFYPEAMRLVERLNIYAARSRKWLPPNYGRTTYRSMDDQERAVVDGFHGDGSEGSGEKSYTAVLAHKDYYLAEPTQQMQALGSGG